MRAALLAVLLLSGCSLAPTDQVLQQLTNSERSWCVSVTSVYGTLRMGGSGARDAVILCNQEGMKVDGIGQGSAPTVPTSGTIIIPAPPRVLMQDAPTYQEIDPSTLPALRKAPPPRVKPQSMPDPRLRDLLEQIRFMR